MSKPVKLTDLLSEEDTSTISEDFNSSKLKIKKHLDVIYNELVELVKTSDIHGTFGVKPRDIKAMVHDVKSMMKTVEKNRP